MKRHKYLVGPVIKHVFLIIIFCITVFPILYIILASFKSNQEVLTAGAALLPKKFVFDNYRQAWELANFKRYTLNSLYMSFFIVIGTIITSTTAGYVFSRGKFPGKKLLFGILTASMFVAAGSLYLYPQFQVAKFLHINKTLWGVIIIRVFGMNITQIFLSNSYLHTISYEIDEAAKIDGCSFFRTYWNIILPLMKPLIATIGLLSFRDAWNDYLLPMVFTLAKPMQAPLVVGVVKLRSAGESVGSYNLMLAGTTISIIPMLMVYLFLNRYFIAGLTSGAVKG